MPGRVWNIEVAENDEEDKDVVNAERFFDDIAREVQQGGLGASDRGARRDVGPELPNQHPKRHAQPNPKGRPFRCELQGGLGVAPLQHGEVEDKEGQDGSDK